jgi:hypothetical protein
MMKAFVIAALLALMVVPLAAAVDAPVWRLTAMCNTPDDSGYVMRARSESADSYSDVLWYKYGSAEQGYIDLLGMDDSTYVPTYFVAPYGTIKLNWNGYETVKATGSTDNYCTSEDMCTYLGDCPQNDVPEFGIIGASLALVGAGLFAFRKRK